MGQAPIVLIGASPIFGVAWGNTPGILEISRIHWLKAKFILREPV
jgi:hypothetical protein